MGLGKFLVKRTLQGLFVIWGVVTVVFLLRHLTPGNPVNTLLPPEASQEQRELFAERLGLNDPVHIQYYDYLVGVAQGDFGVSMATGRPASELILIRLPATIELAVAATVVAVVIAIPLGVISARRRHEPSDYGATIFSLVGISTPNFWLGVMLIIFVAVQFGPLPTGGRGPSFVDAMIATLTQGQFRDGGIVEWGRYILLPAITLGTYFTALLTRLTRSGMVDEIGKAYVKATRAKGLPETLVLYKHVLRNTLIPIITVLGLQLGTLIGGAVITEEVFAWPGLGRFLIHSIYQRDWVLIQGTIIVIGVGFVIVNIVVDALYVYLNPKVDLE
ncbi:ABC transporter permease [Halobacteria archaeon AArc-m2/3/4]|uniref:ABC transporter permease n=1 Tax=Natronoglomus mannanivorans TaxID=2979990 RepID=A0ABT2Q9S7_9EURY|nr:ABC transporter permease [Halobacteria archaeon AArc-m2/3/4]